MRKILIFFWDLAYKQRILVKFILSGGTGALFLLLTLFILTDIFGLFYLFSAILAFILATSVGFLLHKFWTFKDKNTAFLKKQGFYYFSFQAFLFFLNTLGLYVLVDLFGLWYMLAQFILSGTIGVISFFFYKFKVFIHSDYLKSDFAAESGSAPGKKKICYILPKYDAKTHTHFSYLYPFLGKVSKELEIFLIVEKSRGLMEIDGIKKIYRQKKKLKIFRVCENFLASSKASSEGYSDFYVHYSFIGALSAILVTKIKGGKVFYWNCGMPWLYKRGRFEEKVFRYILKNTIFVTGTSGIRDEYVKRYGLLSEKTRVLPNWIDLEEFGKNVWKKEEAREKLNLSQDKKIILFVHHLSQRKGADKILPTAELLSDDYFFVVVGSGPYQKKLRFGILEKNLSERFRLEGVVFHENIGQYFASADIFFMPSEEEGFPHVLLESMALGVPFVASDVGGVSEIIPEESKKFITKKRNPQVFAKLISKGLNAPISSKILTTKAEEYDIEKVWPQFVSLF